jgi:glutamate 5-kinase
MEGKKIVIKLGTKVVSDLAAGGVRRDVLFSLARDVSKLLNKGNEIIIVSSGAVCCGRDAIKGENGLGLKQARAAVGQTRLMNEYSGVFSKFGISVAQFLLNKDDLNSSKLNNIKMAYRNLGHDVIPIVNENDVTTTDELTFGDNDNLAIEILEKFDFDVLYMMTEIGALVSGGKKILESNKFEVSDYDDFGSDKLGCGGLKSKLNVAKRAIDMDKSFIIGKAGDSVIDVLDGKVEATWFCKSLKV